MNEDELTAAFDRLGHDHRVSGAILVSRDRDIVFEKAYGLASQQLGVPNTPAMKFHIASVTKMFIAMAALVLAELGRLSLRERPATYLPELAVLDRDITLHHLLSHTAGLADIYETPDLPFAMQSLKVEHGSLLTYLASLPPLFRPGEGWKYSSTGFILMGYVMQAVTGLTFGELMQQHVLAPLSMTNTGIDDPRLVNPGRAYGHHLEHGRAVNAENDHLSLFPEAPGELYSTVRDLKRWCDALFDCPLVAPQTLQLMLTPYARTGPVFQYGYGCFLGPRYRMHGGGTPGFKSLVRQYQDHKVSVVALFNSDHIEPWQIIDPVEALLLG